jgi:hypothetical protein
MAGQQQAAAAAAGAAGKWCDSPRGNSCWEGPQHVRELLKAEACGHESGGFLGAAAGMVAAQAE